MVASIGVVASPSQGVSHYERDGYYVRDDPVRREASAWAGRSAEDLGLTAPVDPDAFQAVLEGKVPDGPHLGKGTRTGKSTIGQSVMAPFQFRSRCRSWHWWAATRTVAWIEHNAVDTRIQDRASGTMVHVGSQEMVAATFRHDTSRNLDPQLHTHAVAVWRGHRAGPKDPLELTR